MCHLGKQSYHKNKNNLRFSDSLEDHSDIGEQSSSHVTRWTDCALSSFSKASSAEPLIVNRFALIYTMTEFEYSIWKGCQQIYLHFWYSLEKNLFSFILEVLSKLLPTKQSCLILALFFIISSKYGRTHSFGFVIPLFMSFLT